MGWDGLCLGMIIRDFANQFFEGNLNRTLFGIMCFLNEDTEIADKMKILLAKKDAEAKVFLEQTEREVDAAIK